MNNIPFFSIVLPVFNSEKSIKRAIESVLKQKYKNYELLIINDGSTDNSEFIIKNYEVIDKRVKMISIKNSGVSKARNIGLKSAKGCFILFLDSDDFYDENLLQILIELYNQKINLSGLMFLYRINNQKKKVYRSNRKLIEVQINDDHNFIFKIIKNESINYCWNKVFKRSIIEENNLKFDTNLSLGEDLIFCLHYYTAIPKFYFLNEELYVYSKNYGKDNLTARFREERVEIRFKILNEITTFLKRKQVNTKKINPLVNSMLLKDVFAFFMDFHTKKCNLILTERYKLIENVLGEKRVNDMMLDFKSDSLLSCFLFMILKTKNTKLIYFASKILCLKRKF
ncbi:glycosyltransferase family 2 protein [Eubacterium limosum]|uniref:Glycosyltransferase family 2 protein n=1 Tax=Eubacterium limosum TaxID=1736 RepID=A0ABT5UM86_EUBLI|nr:glycosyltransferase family 2 protein [Eubacterium limosum]MCB6568171.1 glycosyltransferase [Eubacterium limosum]MDE1470042.1 glycosyltransferase family 2 protein [Eubacterium limosum]